MDKVKFAKMKLKCKMITLHCCIVDEMQNSMQAEGKILVYLYDSDVMIGKKLGAHVGVHYPNNN